MQGCLARTSHFTGGIFNERESSQVLLPTVCRRPALACIANLKNWEGRRALFSPAHIVQEDVLASRGIGSGLPCSQNKIWCLSAWSNVLTWPLLHPNKIALTQYSGGPRYRHLTSGQADQNARPGAWSSMLLGPCHIYSGREIGPCLRSPNFSLPACWLRASISVIRFY